MGTLLKKLTRFTMAIFVLLPAYAFAAAGSAQRIVFVADSRRFTGWRAWCTNLYNENLLYFTVLTVLIIPTLAVTLGSLASFCMERTGINLKSRIVADH